MRFTHILFYKLMYKDHIMKWIQCDKSSLTLSKRKEIKNLKSIYQLSKAPYSASPSRGHCYVDTLEGLAATLSLVHFCPWFLIITYMFKSNGILDSSEEFCFIYLFTQNEWVFLIFMSSNLYFPDLCLKDYVKAIMEA